MTIKKTTIIRRAKSKDNPYAQISREALQDKTLSWQATGLLSYFLSLPTTWEINIRDLSSRKTKGKHATRSALNELIDKGYAQRTAFRDEKGQFIRHEYVIYEKQTYPLSNFQKVDTREDTHVFKKQNANLSQQDQATKADVINSDLTWTEDMQEH